MKPGKVPLALLVAGIASLAPTAQAAFPGRNGRVAYVLIRTQGALEGPVGDLSSETKIVSVLPNGRRRRTLAGRFHDPLQPLDFEDPAYSPDGRRLAFSFRRTDTLPRSTSDGRMAAGECDG